MNSEEPSILRPLVDQIERRLAFRDIDFHAKLKAVQHEYAARGLARSGAIIEALRGAFRDEAIQRTDAAAVALRDYRFSCSARDLIDAREELHRLLLDAVDQSLSSIQKQTESLIQVIVRATLRTETNSRSLDEHRKHCLELLKAVISELLMATRNGAMQTSEARRAALRVAVHLYEAAKGNLRFATFEIPEAAAEVGVTASEDARQIEDYLTSVGLMEHIGLGASPLRFTAEGIRIVEASLDRPNEPHGPFPAWNVVIGNVHGSQIAIGSGTFTQSHSSDQALDLQHLTDLIKAATATWESDAQSRAAGSAALIEAEARSPAPETSLIMAAAQKIGTVALSVGGNVATAALVAYLKVKGILPP